MPTLEVVVRPRISIDLDLTDMCRCHYLSYLSPEQNTELYGERGASTPL